MRVASICWLASVTALQVHGGRPDMAAHARSATALQVQGGRSYVAARAAPAIARLGTPSSNTGPLDEQELLRELTELETTLSYKGWQKDAAESEEYYTLTYLALLVKKMSEMRHKQQRHGDVHGVRSDPLLRDLDELKATLSYDGWHEDAAKIEEVYITCAEHSRGSMDQMRRKQQLHDVRKVTPLPRSGFPPDLKLLRKLDPLFTKYELACAFSYDGWQADAAEMSAQYMKDPYYVPGMLAEMRRSQVESPGDDSRVRGACCDQGLHELDELNGTLSYEGWQEDVVQASVRCINQVYQVWENEDYIEDMMAQMRRKQQLHDPHGERSGRVPLLQELDELKGTLTYEGWQKDVARTTVECLSDPWDVPDRIAGMHHRQKVHDTTALSAESPTAMAAVSSGRAGGPASGYERSYTDDGTLQIYIPPSGVTVLGGASASGAVVASVFASGSLLRTVALAAGTASAVMPLLCIPVCVVGASFVLKWNVFDPATGTKLTIGRHAWSLVQRTAAGVVTREEDGATKDIAELEVSVISEQQSTALLEFSLDGPLDWYSGEQPVQFKAILPSKHRPPGRALVREVNEQLEFFQAFE